MSDGGMDGERRVENEVVGLRGVEDETVVESKWEDESGFCISSVPLAYAHKFSALFQRGISSRNANFTSWCLLNSIDNFGGRLSLTALRDCLAPLPSPQLSFWV